MAKISSPWVGIASGKLGEGVFYHASGRQCARARNRSPKNPKTAKQAVQRMILATSAKMAAAFKPLVDHSFEGVPVGEESVRLFRKLAMTRLRSAAAGYLDDPSVVNIPADFAIKGAPVVGAVGDLQLSRGSLSLNSFYAQDAGGGLILKSALAETITSQTEYVAELDKLGIEPGDQLTFVTLGHDDQVVASFRPEGSEDIERDYFQFVRYSRVVFKSELPAGFTGGLLSGSAFNPAIVEESEGSLPSCEVVTTQATGEISLATTWPSEYPDGTRGVMLFGVIRTKLLSSKYAYSNCYMQFNVGFFDENDAYPTYMSYMDAVGEINVGDELYLRHAVAAPFV